MGAQISQKSGNHLKIIGDRGETWSKFLGGGTLVVTGNRRPGFTHPWFNRLVKCKLKYAVNVFITYWIYINYQLDALIIIYS